MCPQMAPALIPTVVGCPPSDARCRVPAVGRSPSGARRPAARGVPTADRGPPTLTAASRPPRSG
ncbi:hypothetical protein FM106_12565 [Brachybacterium faecium]|nr:hypothetical protein FM106_12565 [Brachybacterium faecium]